MYSNLVDTLGRWTAIYNPSLLKALLANNLWNDNLLLTQTRREHGHELGSEHLAQHWLATEQILQIAIYISLRKVIGRLGQINYSLVQGVTVIND